MLDVHDVEGMKARLAERSHANFMRVIGEAARQGGHDARDIDYLALLHMKRSAHAAVIDELGLSPQQSYYLEQYGHIGQFDPILSIELGERRGAGSGRARSSSWPAPASATPGARTRCAGERWPSSSVEDTMPAWLST